MMLIFRNLSSKYLVMKLSEYNFYCTECTSKLDTKGIIHLKTERLNGDRGDIFLSTTFGNYEYKHAPLIEFNNHELVEFCCPNCHSSLHSLTKPNYISLTMRVENKFDFEILFSRESGVQKTYIVTEFGMECYGKDCENNKFD
jgi:uncharacterized protein YlaI